MVNLTGDFKRSPARGRPKKPVIFIGMDAGKYIFQTPDEEFCDALSKRAIDDLYHPNNEIERKIRVDGQMVDVYPKAELNKALGLPENFKPIEGVRLGIVKSTGRACNFNF